MPYLLRFALFFSLILLIAQKTEAEPPFLTNKTDPTPYQHKTVLLFSTFEKIGHKVDAKFVRAPIVEGRYGVHPRFDVYLRAVMLTLIPTPPRPQRTQIEGLLTGGRLILFELPQEDLQVSFTPDLIFPTGQTRRFDGKIYAQLPLWFQKGWKSWIFNVGGGYGVVHAPDRFNYSYGGGRIRYKFTEAFLLGIECFYRTRTTVDIKHMTFLNAGGQYYFTKVFGVFGSAGYTVSGTKDRIAQLGMRWDW